MSDGRVTHIPQTHRNAPVKEPVRVATTGNVTIATALNAGDTVDGVTLAAGDRVLVWQQSAPATNGIYIAGVTPARAYDMDDAGEVAGALVVVLEGTTYAATIFQNTNAGAITLGTTDLTFTTAIADFPNAELNIEGGQSVIKAHGSMGAAETFDPTDGNVHTGTLDANATFTISNPSGSGFASLLFWITGSGERTWAWPGTVTWLSGSAPTPPGDGETVIVSLASVDGGTSWVGGPWGGGGTSSGSSVPPPILLASDHGTPFAFDDILQASDGSDFLWTSE